MKFIAFIQRQQQAIIHAILECLDVEKPDLEEMARGPPRWLAHWVRIDSLMTGK